jgi:RNA polymerase sigma factor (sigma-70 family)
MTTVKTPSPEPDILRGRAGGELSCNVAFDKFYRLYSPLVRGWVAISVRAADVDDIVQDVWAVFYQRWRGWRFLPEMYAPDARPVLSFLYRTSRFLLDGHRRRAIRAHEPLGDFDVPDGPDQTEGILRAVEFGQCLNIARKICPQEEMDVLLAKLGGIPGREVAEALSITEAVVDHRFRNAISRLQKKMNPKKQHTGRIRK